MRDAPQLVRLAGAFTALVVAAWFALAAIQARALDDVERIASAAGRPDAAADARAQRLLDRAGWLRPGVEVDLLRAQIASERDDDARALRLLEDAVRREPDNIVAWDRLAAATLRSDPDTWARATAELRRLSPPVPEP